MIYRMWLMTGIRLTHSNYWKIKSTFDYHNKYMRYYAENQATGTLKYRQSKNLVFISWR